MDIMKRRMLLLFLMLGMLTAGCGAAKEIETPDIQISKETVNADESGEPQGEGEHVKEAETEESTLSFADLTNLEFYFASGAGGWRTVMEIKEDGSFSGVHSDSDMGAVGEGYPNGTCYLCVFEGKFTQPVKLNDYTYSMQIEQIGYEHEAGTEEIQDGVLYVYSTAYGLDGAEDVLIYLPGAPFMELPQEYRNWVRNDMENPDALELPFYGLYNVKEQNGFSSCAISKGVSDMIADAKERADAVEASLEHDPLCQADMNEKAAELYAIWDAALNELWAELKDTLREEEFQALLEEQRAWIAEKERAAKEAGQEVAGGSMQGMVMDLKAARMTKERVYELYELLK